MRRQPLTLLTVGLPGYDETQEGLAVLAEYLTGGLDPRRLRVLAARVVAVDKMLDGEGFLEIFESLRGDYSIPSRTAWSIATRVVVGGGSAKDAIYLRGISRILDALGEGSTLDPLLVGKLALDHIPLVQDLLDRGCSSPRGCGRVGSTSRERRSVWTGCAPARPSTTCMKERYRHEARLRRQRRRHRDRRVHHHPAGASRVPRRTRGLVPRGRATSSSARATGT